MKSLAPSLAGLALLAACEPIADFQTQPFVQASVDEAPRWQVFLNRIRDGIARGYQPVCLDSVRPGHVVEFMNFNPEIPANVTSIAGPAPLYSPNLVRPYNYVASDDPANELCDTQGASGCTSRPSWSYWRFRFTTSGVYDWIDTNQGSPGRKVVDPYYGTETFVGIDPNSTIATVCVQNEDGSGCEAVCCASDASCTDGKTCFKGPHDAVGRCRTPSG